MPRCSTRPCTLTIPADPAAISIVTDGVGELLAEKAWPKDDVFAVQLALQEAVANAIRHGCRGDASKHVRCSVSCDDSGAVVIVVQDPGPGFDPAAVSDPLDTANILKPSGRGILLITQLMDDVQFADDGREVRMRKRSSWADQSNGR
jgi:serine/threonine-protein kinase RsbW